MTRKVFLAASAAALAMSAACAQGLVLDRALLDRYFAEFNAGDEELYRNEFDNAGAAKSWDWWCVDGIRYHGHDVTVLFDRDGTHYGRGQGLVVMKDGSIADARTEQGI